MKRVQENDKLQFDLDTDYGEEDCKGVLTLPSNAKIYRSKFSLKDPTDVDTDDLCLIASIITHCSLHIAQRHQKVNATLSRHKRVFDNTLKVIFYVIFIEMPDVNSVDSQQLADIHLLRESLITEPIAASAMKDGGMSLKIVAASTTNAIDTESVTLTRTHITRLRLCTYETANESGSTKRIRRS